ncbi:MAG: class I SAM-dependent methyltransferase [Candidatus Omnitrophota bacterium]|nr:class I SAM-dependent methyltransferase [Candidatus Omnitrophota bacterium]
MTSITDPKPNDACAPLRESAIRAPELRPEALECQERDRQFLLAQQHRFAEVACPACESDKKTIKFIKADFHYCSCSDCATVYISPRPSAELLEEFYSISENYIYWNKYIFPDSEKVRREQIFIPRVNRILDICRKYSVGREAIMEVGAGFGIFCEEMIKKRQFERVIAVEPTADLAATCRSRGLDVLNLPVEKVQLPERSLDVVVSFEVIEHLFSPRDFVRAAARFLKPKGLFILTCPNIMGFETQVAGPATCTFHYEHLNYFHPGSVSRLLADVGFKIHEILTPGELDVQVVKRVFDSGDITLEDNRFFRMLLSSGRDETLNAFQRFLAENGLSSHMWIVASRNN